MVYFLYGLFFLSCLILVAAVLLQPGKTDAGALFTSNVSSSALAPRGTATVLSKITIAAAATFMLSALLLSMPALTGNVSVLSGTPETPAEETATPPADANTNTATGTDANTAADNSNGALIETPATDEFEQKTANANTSNSSNANTSANSATGQEQK